MRLAILAACLVLATPLHALDLRGMSEAEMRAAFFGATLEGEYADGLAWSERFDTAGRSIYAQQGAQADGRIVFVDGEGGRIICFRYEAGFSGGCFEVWARGANCFDFYGVGSDRTAGATVRQRRKGTGWTARAWRKGETRTCVGDLVG